MNGLSAVYRKEIRESLRDRRVLIGAFVVPLFLIFLLTRLMSTLESSLGEGAKLELIAVGQEDNPLIQQLRRSQKAEISTMASESRAVEILKKGKTNLVLSFDPLVPGQQVKARAFYESSRPLSLAAFSGVRQAVAEANTQALKTVLQGQGVDLKAAEPLTIQGRDVGEDKGAGGAAWLTLLPYLVILWSFYGGSSLASDMVAGEKEKKTLETLLLTPVSRVSIAWGKHLALSTICLLSGLMSVVGLGLSSIMAKQGGFHIGLDGLAAFLIVLLPLVLLYAGALLTVSSLARSMREAQTYLTILSFLVLTPAIMSQFIGLTGADRTEWVRWIPILNTSIVMNQALRARVDWLLAVQSGIIALLLAGAAAWICIRLFSREGILRRV